MAAVQIAAKPAYEPAISVATLVRIIFWMGSLAGLGDALTTWYVLTRTHTGAEGNPIMRWPMEHWGILITCLLRAFFGVFIFWHLSRRLMGRPFVPPRLAQVLSRIWYVVSFRWLFNRLFRALRWLCRWIVSIIPTRLARFSRLERVLRYYFDRANKLLLCAWAWLNPRLVAIEFVVAGFLTTLIVGNNLRVVAEVAHWV